MAWYDLDDNKESKREYLQRVKFSEIVTRVAKSFKDIVDGELVDGYQYRIITEQGFNAITVLEYLKNSYKLTDVYIAIYRMNQASVNWIKELSTDKCIRINIVVSSFFRENKKYENWTKMLEEYSKTTTNMTVAFAWSHAKVSLIKTECGKHIVFEGSGNLSDNARIEQYLIEDNRDTYEFHKKWITEIITDNGKD